MNNGSSKNPAKPNAALRLLFAQYYLGHHDSRLFIQWAGKQLVEGQDSPSLRILAGLSGHDSQETQFYLKRTIRELSIAWPEERSCLLHYCAETAREMVAGTMTPADGYNRIYRVVLALDYPRELRRWLGLECEFYPHEGAPDEDRQVARIIVKEARHFLALMDDYESAGVFRLTAQHSLSHLRELGWDVPDDAAAPPKAMPTPSDEQSGLNFFRTRVHNAQFDYLTIPRTYFCRAEFKSVTFECSDLSESMMCWNDWQHCHFSNADLSRCDLRRSSFEHCYFDGANLSGADLRGARFAHCSFRDALMKGAKLTKQFGFSRRWKARALKLSPEQVRDLDWVAKVGDEPPGGQGLSF